MALLTFGSWLSTNSMMFAGPWLCREDDPRDDPLDDVLDGDCRVGLLSLDLSSPDDMSLRCAVVGNEEGILQGGQR